MEPEKIDKVSQRNGLHCTFGGIQPVLVIGFSARALAEAVRETGARVIAVDAFGDFDTRETAKVPQILSNWGAPDSELSLSPDSWAYYSEIERDQPKGAIPVFLAGGLENWPALLERLHSFPALRVLGPTVAQMSALRDPSNWRSAVDGTCVKFPSSLDSLPDNLSLGTGWLLKRKASAGGLGVSEVPNDANYQTPTGTYVQQRIQGRSIGVSCIVSGGSDREVQFIGATESWQSSDWPAPTEFIYRGSFGPITLSEDQQKSVCQVVQNLIACHAEDYRGWVQLDLIEELRGQLWLLEVNPRWTSGMEILRLTKIANMAALHAQAHGLSLSDQPNETSNQQQEEGWSFGKAVYYTSQDLFLSPQVITQLHGLAVRGFKDLPSAESTGLTIPTGHPLLTIFARVARASLTERQCRSEILKQLEEQRLLVDRLWGPG